MEAVHAGLIHRRKESRQGAGRISGLQEQGMVATPELLSEDNGPLGFRLLSLHKKGHEDFLMLPLLL